MAGMAQNRKSTFNLALWGTASLVLGVLTLAGCGGKSSSGPIRIGMAAPLTGNGASFGISQRDGVQLAMEEINAAGGVGGRQIELLIEDTKTEPPVAVTAVNKLIYQQKVPVLIGSAASLDVPAYMEMLEKAQIPEILPVAVLPKITESNLKWTFRNAMNDKLAAAKMAEFAYNTLGARKVALLIEDSAFGATGLRFAERLKELGVEALTVERFKRGDLDFSPQLIKIRSLGATHIQFWGYYADYAQVARKLKELNMKVQLMGNQAPVTNKTIELGGDAVEGAINICLFVPSSEEPKAKSFVEKYRAKYGDLPDTWAAQSYDGMMILAAALRTAGGDDSKKIREALAATKDFQGLTGTISFNDKGDAEFKETFVTKIQGGRFVPFIAPAQR
jgi:branched-chain amino acid transport system substrate-binding protein